MNEPRLDKVLWSLRVFKKRAQATAACRSGHVCIGELESKAGRDVHPGEVFDVRIGIMTRTLKILAIPPSRVSAKQLADFMTDLTPASEYERAKQAAFEHMLARERGRGRPTKKDRRAQNFSAPRAAVAETEHVGRDGIQSVVGLENHEDRQ